MFASIQTWLANSADGLAAYCSLPVVGIAATLIALQKAGWLQAPGWYESGSSGNPQDCDIGGGDHGD